MNILKKKNYQLNKFDAVMLTLVDRHCLQQCIKRTHYSRLDLGRLKLCEIYI